MKKLKDDEFNPYMKFHGLFIPNGIAMSQIPAQAKLLLGRLLQYSGQNGKAYPKRKTLSKELGGLSMSVIDRNIKTLKDLKLIRTYQLNPEDNKAGNLYTFLKNPMYDEPLVRNDKSATVRNDKSTTVRNDKHNIINNNRINVKGFSKEKLTDSGESELLDAIASLKSKSNLPKIVIKNKTTLDPKDRNIIPKKKTLKSKYKHTTICLGNYIELINHGITNHKEDSQAKLNSLDKLYALLSPTLKNPYQDLPYVPEEYIDFKWDIVSLIEVFEYHIRHAEKSNQKRSIGDFIYSKGFNGTPSWSPLLFWHQKMNKTAAGELTEEGKKFLSSLKRTDVKGIVDLDSTIINKVAKEIFSVSNKYVFMDDNTITMTYPFGIIDALSKYIKEKTNNYKFKLVYITKEGFVKEFLSVAKERNILKQKTTMRSVNI